MLNKEIISASIPVLAPSDSPSQALDFLAAYQVAELPLVADDHFLGLVTEDILLNLSEDATLGLLENQPLSKLGIPGNSHIIESMRFFMDHHFTLIPIVEKDGSFLGVITIPDLLQAWGQVTGVADAGGLIVLQMDKRDFSFSEISKLIETNDAQILQLNTWFDAQTTAFYVTIKVSKFEISDILATLQRYDYQIKFYFGEELYENELRNNFDHLMNYLSI